MTAAPAFFEIGTRTNFSFLEGASHPEELVEAASRLCLPGLGVADRNTVAGVVRMHAQAKETGFRFQPGARLVFADDTPDILAYPQNRHGWGNLCRLLSAGNLKGEKGVCILHEADLHAWEEDLLIAVVPKVEHTTSEGYLPGLLRRLASRFGNRAFLALVPRYDGLDRITFAVLASMAEEAGLALIASNEPLYHEAARRPLADIVTAIRTHIPIAEAGFRLAPNAERHLKTGAEMAQLLRHYPQAIANTEEFFSRLSFSLDELRYQYPDESLAGETPSETLERLARSGAARRYPEGVPEKVSKQIDYELALIREKQYEPYFLTVRNIIEFARSEGILCQGRGSAANSVVCYCLGITEVDPKETTLLFERFISTERDEPPDIDVDFEHEKREIVIQHIYERYGREHAGLAAAVSCYRARSAGREVAKAFGLSEDVQSALASTVWGWSAADLSEREARAAGLDMGNLTTQRVLTYASKLIGFPRHLTQHVGGFVITRDRLDEVVPIMKTAMDGRYMVEWDKDDLDTLGILKIDILALGMLTCLARAFKLLESHYGKRITLADLCRDHRRAVYDMICRADTIGVFQIESRAQMSMLPRLRPVNFYDLVIEVAIVRPGPIQGNMVHPYLKRREDDRVGRPISYPRPELERVLKRTLGIPLFQEQVMQIAITAAGFTPGEADRLRRAMATFKRTGTIHTFRKKMVEGMVNNGYDVEFAESCFRQIEGFGEYGFPESHAASFALLVYASSWLKAYYPDIFCVAILNSQPMGFYAPAQLVRDARDHGVVVRPVDINESEWDATLEDGAFERDCIHPRHISMQDVILARKAVRLGFRQVKGLTRKDVDRLLACRGNGYVSVRDLWLRTGLPRSVIERLADADVFRSIQLDRRAALWAAKALDEGSAVEHLPLFTDHDDLQVEPETPLPQMRDSEQVVNDYRYLSLSLKAHPVSFLREQLDTLQIRRCRDLEVVENGRKITIAGLVLVRQRPGSASGIIFMTIEDETGIANIIVWSRTFERFRPVVMGARFIKIHGRLQKADGVIHVVAEEIEDWSSALGLLEGDRHSGLVNAGATSRSMIQQVLGKPGNPTGMFPSAGSTRDAMPKGRNFH